MGLLCPFSHSQRSFKSQCKKAPGSKKRPEHQRASGEPAVTCALGGNAGDPALCSGVKMLTSLCLETPVGTKGPRSTWDSCEYGTLLPCHSWN